MDDLPRMPPDPAVQSRFRGCLLGGAVGDALGAPVEFMGTGEILDTFGEPGIRDYIPAYGRRGAVTDDTQMTLFTAEGLLRGLVRGSLKGICHLPGVVGHACLRWLRTQGEKPASGIKVGMDGWLVSHDELFSRREPGGTCLSALREMKNFGHRARNDSKGCGGVMRAAPVGLFQAAGRRAHTGERDFMDQTFTLAADCAAVTHGHPTGQLTAGVLAVVVALLVRGNGLDEAVGKSLIPLSGHPDHKETMRAIDRAQRLADEAPGSREALVSLGRGWVAEEALAMGVYCALSAGDFEEGIVLAVNHGGDSDSTGSITGNILGAKLGVEAIPKRWLEPLELREVIEAVSDDLASWPEWDIDIDDETGETDYYWKRYPGW